MPTLRTQLKKPDDVKYFSGKERKMLKEQVRAAGLATDQANAMALSGRGRPLLAVFDPATLQLTAIFKLH